MSTLKFTYNQPSQTTGYITTCGTNITITNTNYPLNDIKSSLGTLLSWHSMHSRYIISRNSKIEVNSPDDNGLLAIPVPPASLFRLTEPDTGKENQIMIWDNSKDNNLYKNIDNITWNTGSVPSNRYNIYESSYVGIDYFLTNGSSKSFTSLSNEVTNNKNDISHLSNRIKMIEHFLGGANPPDHNSPNKIKNYYLGLSGNVPKPPAWPDISNQSIWRQFI